jgi:membrane protease YdiL (CAAX protease family)
MAATTQTQRIFEVTAVVALWIAFGIVLHLSVNVYLLLGIPLTAAFQWGVRRQPVRALWVREAMPFRLGAAGCAMAVALAAYPCYRLAKSLRAGGHSAEPLWCLAAVAGALAAAYALQNFRRDNFRHLGFCLGTAGLLGIVIMIVSVLKMGMAHRGFEARASEGLTTMLLYVPLVFVQEEVTFRGAFDSHVQHPGDGRGGLTAVVVSALWGLWHIPLLLGQKPLLLLVPGLLAVHIVIGLPLSIAWRRSGNLFVPGVTHALVDAVRNALLL